MSGRKDPGGQARHDVDPIMTDLNRLTFSESLRQVSQGELVPGDVMASCLQQTQRREPVVKAFASVHPPDLLLEQAGHGGGLLRGLPFAAKDVYESADLPTEYGSPLFRGNRPRADAAGIAALRRAGGVLVGKTSTAELAYYFPAPTSNPHDPLRTPGGSSSGSAAAIAAGMVPVALGTQTAGSTIRPASYCGVVGYVCTHGELATRGVQQLAPSLDSVGIMARSVEDIQLIRSLLLAGIATSGRERIKTPVSIAVLDDPIAAELEPSMASAMHAATAAAVEAGVQISRPIRPELVAELIRLHEIVMAFEAARSLVWEYGQPEHLSGVLHQFLEQGWATSADAYRAAIARIAEIAIEMMLALADSDAVLCPGAPGPAPVGLGSTGSPAWSRAWQALGMPAVAVPGLADDNGMPLGLQVVGKRYDDDRLLAAGRWLESILPAPPVPPD